MWGKGGLRSWRSEARFSPLELRRLLLSGEVVALRSGEGSGWDVGAGLVAFPLRMSMTCRKGGITIRPLLPTLLSLSPVLKRTVGSVPQSPLSELAPTDPQAVPLPCAHSDVHPRGPARGHRPCQRAHSPGGCAPP